MKISVFGLGYVGSVTAACLCREGHSVVGIDVQPQKVDSFNAGVAPIIEPGLKELLQAAKAKGLLQATLDSQEAIAATDTSVVCVGTPSCINGALDLRFVRGAVQQIGEALRQKRKSHRLILRSTMLPGSTRRLVQESLGDLLDGGLLEVFYFPEFLRESSAVADFDNPSLAVVGTKEGLPPPPALRRELFGEQAAVTTWDTAEMVKYACNAFHATKVVFANEIGRVARHLGVDSHVVMELLCRDTKLNLSPYYLRPGNPFGGSCLPKDIRALTSHARAQGVHMPLVENLLLSNERHYQALLSLILESGQNEICILGLSFKPNTDDLRESTMVEVAQALLGRGYTLRIYDPALNLATLLGANKRVIDMKMPHLASLLCSDLGLALGQQGLVVAAQRCVSVQELKPHISPAHRILDVNGWSELKTLPARYERFC